MRRATLLSWAFVGDMDWAKSSQHPYAIGLTWEPLRSRIAWENDENLNYFGFLWSSLRSMQQATLLSWTFVGDMNCVMSPQHPYAINATWEPLWSDIPWEDGESSNDFGPSWSFSKFMLRTALLSWTSVGVIDNVESLPTLIWYWFDLRITLKSYAQRVNDESSRKNPKYHFTDLYFFWLFLVLFLRPNFHFRTRIFSNVYFPDNRILKKKQV